jgi:uroporphyrinogen-III synthase
LRFHLLALRPEPGLAATLGKARALGLAITGHPLSAIRPLAWECPDPAGIDGLLIGSANAILHGGPHLAELTAKPVYAVGEATAAAARAAGFTVALTGTGGLQGVLDALPSFGAPPRHLLRIAGEEHVPLTPPQGVTFAEVIAYRSEALPLDPAAPVLASGEALVLLHSAATAAHFAAEVDRLRLDRARITLAALGPRIAAAAGPKEQGRWAAIHTAPTPDEHALLHLAMQLAFDLCQEARSIPPFPPRQP